MRQKNEAQLSEKRILHKVVEHCYQMLELADLYEYYQHTPDSAAITGVMRDAAYKIRNLAQRELNQDWWQSPQDKD